MHMLTGSRTGFVSKLASPYASSLERDIWRLWSIPHKHMETSKQINKTTNSILWHYVTEQKPEWDIFVQLLTHAYSAQGIFLGTWHLKAWYFAKYPGSITFDGPTALRSDPTATTCLHHGENNSYNV